MPSAGLKCGALFGVYVNGVQILAEFPTELMKASAAARLAGGRGIAVEIQA